MQRFRIKSLHFIIMILSVSFLTVSCSTMSFMQRKEDRRLAKKQKDISQTRDDREDVYRQQVEQQHKMQTKETRKRMRELERKSKRWREGKGDPFYERWIQRWQEIRENRRQSRYD